MDKFKTLYNPNPKYSKLEMIIRLLLVILLIGVVSAQTGNACSTMDDCNKVYYLCHNNVCDHCSSTKPCSPAHTVRTICDTTNYNSDRCIQCSSNAGCSGGKKCVTNKQVYLCADTCTDPTSPCTATSQCIYIANDNGSGGGFYCLSCENSADCRKWSGSSSSTCSSGKCSPAFVSCGQHSDCRSLTASYCNGDNVCKPCTSNSHCNRFTATPICNSGTCVQCNGHSDCPAIETAQCLSNTCVPCTANTHCSRFSATPVCKTSEGKCVKCVEHSDCNSASASQCSASNTCITCSDPSHCAHITSKPYCGTPSNLGVCVQCQTNLDCDSASASRCSSAGTCSSCNDSDQCEHITGKPICKTSGGPGQCVQCIAHSDCPSASAARCSGNTCIACNADDQCAHLTSVCKNPGTSGVCVQCVYNTNCLTPTASQCQGSTNTCIACTESSHCSHLPSAGVCKDPETAGTCVQCISNTNCSNAAAAQCSASNTCIACTEDNHCTHLSPKSKCKDPTTAGRCVQCIEDADCPYTSANCKSDTNSCVGCGSNSHCSRFSSTPVCKTPGAGTGVCVECVSHSDCPSETAAQCSLGTNTCGPCTANTACAHFTDTPVCKNPGETGTCVQCVVDADCPTAAAAQCSGSNTCIPCTDSNQCTHLAGTPVCKDPGATGTCVQCVVDSDCPSKSAAKCSANVCVPCTDSEQCTRFSGTTMCSNPSGGTCVQCNNDSDCPTTALARCASNTCAKCQVNGQCERFSETPVCSSSLNGGTCVQCVSDSDCPTEAAAKCSSYACVPCTASNQCTRFSATPFCSNPLGGTCVECNNNSDCPTIALPRCSSNTCTTCIANDQCERFSDTPVCSSPSGGTCVQCVDHSDCPTEAAAQCTGSNTCIPCTANSHCAHFSPTPVCNSPSGGTCVQCVDHSDCPTVALAQCLSNTCITCTENSHCTHLAPNSLCNTTNGECVECLSISDCTGGKICSPSGACIPCTDSSECTLDPILFCNTTIGACVECLADANCLNATASHCSLDDNTCVPCTDSSHCEHFISTTLCAIAGSAPGICTPRCVTNCLECYNSTNCKRCLSAHYLLNTTACLTTCPDGYMENNKTMTCDLCDPTCQTCDVNINNCTSCYSPYVLDKHTCRAPLGIPPPTATLKSTSDPQTFLLTFSNPMAITSETLVEDLRFSLTNMNPSEYYLLNITEQPDNKTFRITFNFTRSLGIETLTVSFSNKRAIVDKNGLIMVQDSASAATVRFTFFTMAEKAAAEALTNVGSSVSDAALTSSVGMFFAGGGGILWAFLGIFQIVNYLLYLNVNYPYNVVAFFQLFSVSSINAIIPNPIQYVFPDIYEKMQVGLPSPPKFMDNEMDALYMNNAGATLAAWIALGTLYIFIKIILFIFRTNGRFNRIITNFRAKFEWGIVYNALIGTYPDLIIASCLQYINMNFTTPINTFSSVSSLVLGGCCFWAPFAVTSALESSAEVLGTEYHAQKHGVLYEDFIVESRKNVKPETAYYRRNFMAFVFLRKLTYFSGIVLAYDIPILQMLISCCSGLVLLIFMIRVKPYRHKRDAWMNIGSEAILVMIHLVIFLFAGDDITLTMSDTQRKTIGWVIIILCCLLVAYNAIFIFAQQVLAAWKVMKLVCGMCNKKKKPENKKASNNESSTTNINMTQNVTENRTEAANNTEKSLRFETSIPTITTKPPISTKPMVTTKPPITTKSKKSKSNSKAPS